MSLIRPPRALIPAIMLVLSAGSSVFGAGVREATLATADGPRHYLVATPPGGVRPGAPLVLLFHGHLGSARNTLGQGVGTGSPLSAWLAVVDREGVVVAALDGARGEDRKQGWNDGRPGNSGNPTTDDVGFARGVRDLLEKELAIDPSRVYAMGMSNGGVFVFRLAREMPLAAFAAVCASMPGDRPPAPAKRPVSALMIEGTEDPLMPYDGGQVHFYSKALGAVLGTDASLAYWRSVDGLSGSPVVEAVPHLGRDGTHLSRSTWGPAGGVQVRLLRVEGGGHCEPSLAHPLGWLYTQVCGVQNHDVEAAEEAWGFFKDKRIR
jgi:polyhydroxybutyrate depolymerase